MKKRTFTLKMAAVAFALGILSIGSPALAEDEKIYPGSMCVKWSGPNPTYNFSSIENPSSSSFMHLDCPVIKDVIDKSINDARVTVVDRHYSQNVQCSLNSFYHYNGGFWGWSTPNKSSLGSSPNAQTLTFGQVGANSSAHYYIGCRVPATYLGSRSAVVSYRVDEK